MIINNKRNRKNDNKRRYDYSKKNNANHKYVYNTGFWRALRLEYLRLNPICEMCNSKGKISPAIEVHHIIPLSSAKNINEKKQIGFDWNNLMALCDKCHKDKHLQRNNYINDYVNKNEKNND